MALILMGFDEESATGLGQLIALIGFGWVNTKIAYRWFDVFLVFVPIFGVIYIVKTLWRAVSLPYAYWEHDELPSGGSPSGRHDAPHPQETMRLATYMDAVDHGMPTTVAALSSVALFSFDDGCPPSPHFEVGVRAKRWEFTTNTQTTSDFNEIGTAARAALERYPALAEEHSEHYYVHRLTDVLTKNQPVRRQQTETPERFRLGHGVSEFQNADKPTRTEAE